MPRGRAVDTHPSQRNELSVADESVAWPPSPFQTRDGIEKQPSWDESFTGNQRALLVLRVDHAKAKLQHGEVLGLEVDGVREHYVQRVLAGADESQTVTRGECKAAQGVRRC